MKNLSESKVLVTGADGFIGSHLVEALVEQGCDVRALSLYNSFNYWGWLEDIPVLDKIEVVTGDVRDPFFCNKLCKDIDYVFHLGALIAIPYSYIAPQVYVETNVNGTVNMCEAALKNNVQRIIQTSTSEVYGTANYVPIDEKHPLQPQSPYSASKISSDAMAMSYYNSFSLPLSVARPFNTYGPRQSARAVIPTVITQIANGKKEIHLGDITPTRDFNYVKDICQGFIAIAKAEKTIGEVVNIGSNSEYSIGSMVEQVASLMNSSVKIITKEERIRPENSEVFRLVCDNKKIKELAGYEVKYDFQAGLKESIEWFTQPENLKKYKANIYNV